MQRMDAFVAQTSAEIEQLVAEDFEDEQRVAERIEELTSRPNTAALQRPCTASVPSRIAHQPSVLACLADITTTHNESEESFYARIIQTARQQQQQQKEQHTESKKGDKQANSSKQRRDNSKRSTINQQQQSVDESLSNQKRESVADIYVVPSRTHSPPLGSSRPSTSSSASSLALSSATRHSLTSTSSTSATPRSQLFDSLCDDSDRHRTSTGTMHTAHVSQQSALDRAEWYVSQSQVDTGSGADRPFSRRTSIRSRFPAINK